MTYTDKGNIQEYLNVDIASSFDSAITEWIQAVELWINRYTGKSFEVGAETTRYFDTCGGKSVFVDTFTGTPSEVSMISSDGNVEATLTEGHTNDYLRYPLNTSEKNEIVLTANSRHGRFGHGSSRLKITATFGYGTVPKDIQLVATKLVAAIVEKGLKGGKLASVSLGDTTSSFQSIDEYAEIMGIGAVLDSYREIAI